MKKFFIIMWVLMTLSLSIAYAIDKVAPKPPTNLRIVEITR